MVAKKPKLLILMPGPIYNIESFFGARLRSLSNNYRGTLLTYSHEASIQLIGDFQVISIGTGDKAGQNKKFTKFLREVLKEARSAAAKNDAYNAVTCYDPLKVGIIAAIVATLYPLKLIVEVNGVFTSRYNYVDIKNRSSACIKRFIFPIVEAFVLRRANGIKLLFPTQIDPLKPFIKPDTKVIRAFPDYTNTNAFKNLGENKEIFFAGFPFFLKGVDVLIDAFKQVAAEFPDWTLKILGWFENKSYVEQYIGDHPQITLHRPVDRSEMPAHMGRTGVVVLPSRTEGMGRVLLEAMACEKPRIGSRIEGIPYVIKDGADGLLVGSGSVDELSNALRRMMSDQQLRRQFGDQGRKRLLEEFSEAMYFKSLHEFYSAILS